MFEILLTAFTTVATIAIGYGANYLRVKSKNTALDSAVDILEKISYDIVEVVRRRVVAELKEAPSDRKVSEQEIQRIVTKTLDDVKRQMPDYSFKVLENAGTSLRAFVESKVRANLPGA